LPYLVLCGCFMRTAELVRMYQAEKVLQWSDIFWQDGLIHVRPGVAKGTKRESDERYTPISEAARRWLLPIKRESGDYVPVAAKRFGELWRKMIDEAGVPRIDNGLRHSAVSYSLAANPEHGLALTAQWCRNSEATIRKHYRRLIKPEQGKAWFAVEHFAEKMERLQAKIRELHDLWPGDSTSHGIYVTDPATLPGIWRDKS